MSTSYPAESPLRHVARWALRVLCATILLGVLGMHGLAPTPPTPPAHAADEPPRSAPHADPAHQGTSDVAASCSCPPSEHLHQGPTCQATPAWSGGTVAPPVLSDRQATVTTLSWHGVGFLIEDPGARRPPSLTALQICRT